jgi:proline dehydrogenase
MGLMDKLVVWTIPFVPKPIVGYFSKPYIAGARLEDAVKKVKELNAKGMMATLDLLGEESRDKAEAEEAAAEYKNILKTIEDHKLDSNISIKPTQFGMLIDTEFCYNNIEQLVQEAKKYKNFVRIDMEDHTVTSDTLDIFYRLKEKYEGHVGIVIQAYLRRTSDDINKLIENKANLRLCKGIYVEPRKAAYKDMEIINDSFRFNLKKLLAAKCYTGIATHDEKLVWHALSVIEELGLKKDEYEFQMLLGVDEQLRQIIVDSGQRLRVYIPFGKNWYAYSTRRLKENPKMAGYVFKSIFGIK